MIIPVEKPFRVSSPYGPRVLNGEKQFHKGIDFVSEKSDSVFSVSDGVVAYDQDDYTEALRWTDGHHSAGNMVIVRHELKSGLCYIRYLHLFENEIRKGQKVSKGDLLGIYADVGRSFGAHLHTDAYDEKWRPINITLLFHDEGLLL